VAYPASLLPTAPPSALATLLTARRHIDLLRVSTAGC
jgi:hypothetical protein